jgi:YVTN family beta-propeller protein
MTFEDFHVDGFTGNAPTGLTRPVALFMVLFLATGCGVDFIGEDPPKGTLFDPAGMALHPSGQYLYVVNSNFDLGFREDRGGTVVVVDTDTFEIDPEATLQIGSFGGEIALNSPEGGEPTQAYVAVRGDRSVVALKVEEGGRRLKCTDSSPLTSRCAIPTVNRDPFSLAVTTTQAVVEGNQVSVDFVGVAHLLGGNVTGLSVRDGDVESTSRVSAALVSGANDIALSPRNGHFYATSRFSNAVVAFRPVIDTDGSVAGVFETGEVFIDSAPPSGGFDSRGIAFNEAGTLAYVANRGPSSLVIIDTGPEDLETGAGTRNKVVDILLMPSQPSEVVVVQVGDKELVYVTSFEDKSITVVDPEVRAVVDVIELSAEPYSVAVDQTRHKRLYTTLFSANAVAVIDIDPASPSFNQVTAVIR